MKYNSYWDKTFNPSRHWSRDIPILPTEATSPPPSKPLFLTFYIPLLHLTTNHKSGIFQFFFQLKKLSFNCVIGPQAESEGTGFWGRRWHFSGAVVPLNVVRDVLGLFCENWIAFREFVGGLPFLLLEGILIHSVILIQAGMLLQTQERQV